MHEDPSQRHVQMKIQRLRGTVSISPELIETMDKTRQADRVMEQFPPKPPGTTYLFQPSHADFQGVTDFNGTGPSKHDARPASLQKILGQRYHTKYSVLRTVPYSSRCCFTN